MLKRREETEEKGKDRQYGNIFLLRRPKYSVYTFMHWKIYWKSSSSFSFSSLRFNMTTYGQIFYYGAQKTRFKLFCIETIYWRSFPILPLLWENELLLVFLVSILYALLFDQFKKIQKMWRSSHFGLNRWQV